MSAGESAKENTSVTVETSTAPAFTASTAKDSLALNEPLSAKWKLVRYQVSISRV